MIYSVLAANSLLLCICLLVYKKFKKQNSFVKMARLHPILIASMIYSCLMYPIVIVFWNSWNVFSGAMAFCCCGSYLIAFLIGKICYMKGDKS